MIDDLICENVYLLCTCIKCFGFLLYAFDASALLFTARSVFVSQFRVASNLLRGDLFGVYTATAPGARVIIQKRSA